MSCNNGEKKKSTYTGNQVGDMNYTGDMNYVAGGPVGSGLSAGTTVSQVIPNGLSRRPWLRADAKMNDQLLDAAYPAMELQWFVEILLEPGVLFRLSNKPFYVQDENGDSRYYDPRVERPPTISVTVGEWLSPNYEVSDATFTINNRDGFFNQYLPGGDKYRNWTSASVVVKVGFGEKYDNYEAIFEGQVTKTAGLTSDRDSITVKAYDKLDLDEIPMPPRTYSIDSYPYVDDAYAGKSIPIIYGDWTTDVPDAGSIVAVCVNANEPDPAGHIFRVADGRISITEAWLHRGSRKEGEPGGPIKIDYVTMYQDSWEDGYFTLPLGVDVLASEVTYGSGTTTAGAGSGVNLVTATDASVNFHDMKIQVGDKIIKRKTGEFGNITLVTATTLSTSGGVGGPITFDSGDEYVVLTRKYAFVKGDKITVKCTGRRVGFSQQRISAISEEITSPTGLGFNAADRTLWISDDTAQKVYNVSFKNSIIQEIAYADIHPDLTSVSGIAIGPDTKLYLTSAVTSSVYRYDPAANLLGFVYSTADIVGIGSTVGALTGVQVQSNNMFWLYDNTTGIFYLVDPFSSTAPFVVRSIDRATSGGDGTSVILCFAYDEVHDQILYYDRTRYIVARVDSTTGVMASSFEGAYLGTFSYNTVGLAVAQDESLFSIDQGTMKISNFYDGTDTYGNPAFIARDLLQTFGGHTYEEFDLSWNDTARQLEQFRSRLVIDKPTNLITTVNKLLAQFNTNFFLRFGMFALFFIDFANFRTNGRLVTEKDIKLSSFKPEKEPNQYFNSITAKYNYRPFNSSTVLSDTYVSGAGVSFAGREVNRQVELNNVFRRQDLDKILPILVKLSVPEPEFVQVTMGFRVIRTQMQDFLTVDFNGDLDCATGLRDSGRRYDHVPCMVRKIQYDLQYMTVSFKLWSMIGTAFPGWTPKGRTIGGVDDAVLLSNVGRAGRISPIGDITSSPTSTTIVIADADGQNAETRTASPAGLCWVPTYAVAIMDGATKEVLQVLTIQSVSGDTITFNEEITATVSATTRNVAGFITGGTYLSYAPYDDLVALQKASFASFSNPLDSYPGTRTEEIDEQRAGVHNFNDGGTPYLVYPLGFTEY